MIEKKWHIGYSKKKMLPEVRHLQKIMEYRAIISMWSESIAGIAVATSKLYLVKQDRKRNG